MRPVVQFIKRGTEMPFDSARALKRSTGRAKSDVANKLVSMFLHEVSRKVCLAGGLAVADGKYGQAIQLTFGNGCLYCGKALEDDKAVVEHLDGMNRIRAGLHIPGNVAVSCKMCNTEKRRDDQNPALSLAVSGWESFLSHDGTRCGVSCKTCLYWTGLYPDDFLRISTMRDALEKIRNFRKSYSEFTHLAEKLNSQICDKLETLYRDCQHFATDEISKLTSGLSAEIESH